MQENIQALLINKNSINIGPRTRRPKKPPSEKGSSSDEKRPRTAFSGPQLARLKVRIVCQTEYYRFGNNKYY